jgi:hypothetical protein
MTAAIGAAQQEKPPSKPPSKGDAVVVRGCLSGSALASTETRIVDGADPRRERASAVTFRLTGDSSVLKQMRKDHDGHLVEVTGILKSDLPTDDGRHVKTIGKTRIVVGVRSPQTTQPHDPPYRPVLQVKSYEGLATICRG